MILIKFIALLALGFACSPMSALAEETPSGVLAWPHQPDMTGDWGGQRQSLVDNGVTLESSYIGEFVRNHSPGLVNGGGKSTIYHDNLDISLTLDSEGMGLWSGGTLYVDGLYNHGGLPSANVIGDAQVVSNIEAPRQFIVYEAWYEQNFMDGALSLLAGLHDLNSEFYASEYAGLFLNSSFGTGPEMGNVAASIFPRPGLAARIRVQPVDSVYLAVAAYDGDPATRKLSGAEGRMYIGEAGFSMDAVSLKAGTWRHTATVNYRAATFAHNQGYYAVADFRAYESGDSYVGLFTQYGHAFADRNDLTGYHGGGINMHGLIPTRGDDDMGLAVAALRTRTGTETAIELTYRARLTGWFAVQPAFQWIRNTGGVSGAQGSRISMLRFEVSI